MKNIYILALAAVAGSASAQSFFDGFENSTFTTTPSGGTVSGDHNWTAVNASAPLGTGAQWFQGNTTVFTAHEGQKYAATNFQATSGANQISTWLMSEVRTFNNGDTISFYSRTVDFPGFPDRLHLKLSGNGASTAVGDFTTNLLTINSGLSTSGYPSVWTQFSVTISGLNAPTSGRFAFNYEMPNAGPLGNNSDYIGVDAVDYKAVPEPATMSALALGALAAMRRRRSK